MAQGFGLLVTNARLGCGQSSDGSQIMARLHKNEELVFLSEILPLDAGFVAMIGGISAVLVAALFLATAGLHWRFCVRHPAALPVRRQSFRFTFARPNPVTAIALVSA